MVNAAGTISTVLGSSKTPVIMGLLTIIGIFVVFVWLLSLISKEGAKATAQKELISKFFSKENFVIIMGATLFVVIIGMLMVKFISSLLGQGSFQASTAITWISYSLAIYLAVTYLFPALTSVYPSTAVKPRVWLAMMILILLIAFGFMAPKLVPELAVLSQSVVDLGQGTMSIFGIG